MKNAFRLYLTTYALILMAVFWAQGTVVSDDYLTVGVASAFLFPPVFLPFAIWRLMFRRKRRGGTGLERVLFYWPTGDAFCVADLLQSVFVYGKTGSGKSSGSALGLIRAMLSCGAGILYLCSKPEDRAWIIARAAEAGRSGDVLVFAPDTGLKCNAIDLQLKAGVDARGITEFMSAMKEMQTRGKGKNSSDPFWELSADDEFLYSIEPLGLAYGRVAAHEIRQFISTSPKSAQCFLSGDDDVHGHGKAYRGGFHYKTMVLACKNVVTTIERFDFEATQSWWNSHYANLDSKPRSSIEAGMMTTLNVFATGMVRDKLSDVTNVTPADLERGAIIVVDYPVSTYGATGKAIMGCWKFITQKHLLRRKFHPNDRPVIIYSDECQNLLTEFDSKFIDECRSHGGGLCFLTQGLSNYKSALGEDAAKALVGQAGHSIFHVVDPYTAAFASEMVGNAMQDHYGGSFNAPQNLFDQMAGVGQWNGNVGQGVRAIKEAREFSVGRTGGARSGLVVDSHVIRTGLPFADGGNCIRVSWSQK